jgi:hypothetical protein
MRASTLRAVLLGTGFSLLAGMAQAGLPFEPGQWRFVATTRNHLVPARELAYTGLATAQIEKADTLAPVRNLKNAALAYRAWRVGDAYLYTANFYWERDPERLLGTQGVPVVYSRIAKYPDLVTRYNAITPTQVSWTIHARAVPVAADGGSYRPIHLRVPHESVVMGGSGTGNLPLVPQAAIDWKRVFSLEGDSQRRWTGDDRSQTARLSETLARATSLIGPENSPIVELKVEWPDKEIDEINRLYALYEKGEVEPSPLAEVTQKTSLLPALPRAATGDFWGEPVDVPIKIALDRDLNDTSTANGVTEIRGRITGPKALLKRGIVRAQGYRQEFPIGDDGRFLSSVVLSSGANRIVIAAAGKEVVQNITLTRAPSRLRATLTWNTNGSDIDLHMEDPQRRVASYRAKSVGGMTLDVDNTQGFGPENIFVAQPMSGAYTVRVHNFKNGAGAEATVYVFIDEKLKEVRKVRFASQGEMVTVGSYELPTTPSAPSRDDADDAQTRWMKKQLDAQRQALASSEPSKTREAFAEAIIVCTKPDDRGNFRCLTPVDVISGGPADKDWRTPDALVAWASASCPGARRLASATHLVWGCGFGATNNANSLDRSAGVDVSGRRTYYCAPKETSCRRTSP